MDPKNRSIAQELMKEIQSILWDADKELDENGFVSDESIIKIKSITDDIANHKTLNEYYYTVTTLKRAEALLEKSQKI